MYCVSVVQRQTSTMFLDFLISCSSRKVGFCLVQKLLLLRSLRMGEGGRRPYTAL